jgi:hypothetical protein
MSTPVAEVSLFVGHSQLIFRRKSARKHSARSDALRPRPRPRRPRVSASASHLGFAKLRIHRFECADKSEPAAKEGGKDAKDAKAAKASKSTDDDPDGAKMMQVEAPLEEACKYLSTLQTFCFDRVDTHVAACEIYRRLGARSLECTTMCADMMHLPSGVCVACLPEFALDCRQAAARSAGYQPRAQTGCFTLWDSSAVHHFCGRA